jgi:hypothetical protein
MYKFIVSCYYWPAGERGLRLRALTIKRHFEETGNDLSYWTIGRLTSLDKLATSIERRSVRRLKAKCEVELMASLSLLDNDVQTSSVALRISVQMGWGWSCPRRSSTSDFAVGRTG